MTGIGIETNGSERETDESVINAMEMKFVDAINQQASEVNGVTVVECAYALLQAAVGLVEGDDSWGEFLEDALMEIILFSHPDISEAQLLGLAEFTGTMQ